MKRSASYQKSHTIHVALGLMGYSNDNKQTNPYFNISKNSNGVTYKYQDKRAADSFTLVRYYWSYFAGWGFISFAEEIMQPQPGPPYFYNNGTNYHVDPTRTLQQTFNPSNWGINNRYISVCVFGYYNSNTISNNKTCSNQSI